MSAFKRWLPGFSRLAVVLFVSFWVFFPFYQIHDNSKSIDLIHHHLYRYAGGLNMPMPGQWLVEMATDSFLAKSADEKQYLAKVYFEKHIEGLAREYFYDTEEFKKWFIKTATLSLDQAPIKEYAPWSDTPNYIIRYREIPSDGMPHVQIWRAFFDKWILLFTLCASIVVTLFFAICFFTIRWLVQGFSRKDTA